MMEQDSKVPAVQTAKSKLSCFGRDENGVTAVEFALVAFPFFVFIFAIIELGVSFVAQQMLSSATDDVARRFYTGELNRANTTPEAVHDSICGKIQFMVAAGCPNLAINLNNYDNFADVPIKNLITTEGRLGLPATINIGGPSTINQINVLYRWPAITSIMSLITPGISADKNIVPLFTTMTWRNEPF